MSRLPPAVLKLRLASDVDVEQYLRWEEEKDRVAIADFIRRRFDERFVAPLKSMKPKHGFCMMAISCMLTEAIISFREGWQNPTEIREKPYKAFFREHPSFGATSAQAQELYDNIRSGILHIGETYGGWRIHRKGPMFDFDQKTINAELYAKEVEKALHDYCDELKRQTWDKKIWINVRSRMKALIRHCHISE